jgi:hypothetical protein
MTSPGPGRAKQAPTPFFPRPLHLYSNPSRSAPVPSTVRIVRLPPTNHLPHQVASSSPTKPKWLPPVTNREARDLEKIGEKYTVLWGAKVIYIITNNLNTTDIEALLVPLGAIDTGSLKNEKVAGALAKQQSRWQCAILTDFLIPLVGRLIAAWADNESNRHKNFEHL